MNEAKPRGGARPGAGRKPASEPLVLIQIRIPQSIADKMGDNRTRFAREAIEKKIKEQPHD